MPRLKKAGKWLGIILTMLLVILSVAYAIIYARTEHRINKQYTFNEPPLPITMDSILVARGRHLYQIRSCADCHGANLQGGVFMNDAGLMQLTAPNLTKGKGGLPSSFSTEDWVRVLRHGVDENGRSLWMMPSHENSTLSKEDLACLVAFCQSAPPVDRDSARLRKIGPIGRLLMVLDKVAVLPAERIQHQSTAITTTPTDFICYGKYLASVCEGCHRPNMKGGGPLAPGFPPVPDISATGAPGKWNNAQFIAAIRTGKTPGGKQLRNEYMPWQNMKSFSDKELQSIYTYLQSLR